MTHEILFCDSVLQPTDFVVHFVVFPSFLFPAPGLGGVGIGGPEELSGSADDRGIAGDCGGFP